MTPLWGGLAVALGGLFMGSGVWTLKALKKLQFEHWLFIFVLVALIIMPWGVTLAACPNAMAALATVPGGVLLKANVFAFGWGIANVLCGLCFVRIGVALTGGILGGLGMALGVTVPMVFKASGLFEKAPSLGSAAGLTVLGGVAVMLGGVVLVAFAGFGRERVLKSRQVTSGSFSGGLIMVIIAGLLSTGPNFAFAYSQGPIVQAMKSQGAGDSAAMFAVWAVGMLAGALVNLGFGAYLMTRNDTWKLLRAAPGETLLPALMGVQFCVAIWLLGAGNLGLGVLGASVGWGIYQAMQIIGNQGVGFLSGEWAGVGGTPYRQMVAAIVVLLVAASIMAYGNSLAGA
jgi:L-rhamnose-H+ transport protein